MDATVDGQVEAVFGVRLGDGQYEARRGAAEFRGGRLVHLQVGTSKALEADGGLTVAVTLLTDVSDAAPDSSGFVPARAADRVYVKGALDSMMDVGLVLVRRDVS